MRLGALVFLLVLTAADYVLWDWSIADGHDIVSLVAGLTLLPLAAVSLGGLLLMGARLLGTLFGRSSTSARGGTLAAQPADPSQREHDASRSQSDSSSRLAA